MMLDVGRHPWALGTPCNAPLAWWLAPPGRRRQHFARATPKATTPASDLQPGDVVEFSKDSRTACGLVIEPDGKRNYFVLDVGTGRRSSISPKQVVWKLPGGPFTEAQARELLQAAEQALSNNTTALDTGNPLLSDAWEMAVADNIPKLSLVELTGLIMDDESTHNLFAMYRLLAADRLFFKQVGGKAASTAAMPVYEPRSSDAVAVQRAALAAEAAVRRDEEAWAAAVRGALGVKRRSEQPTPQAWAVGQHAQRIAALKEVATRDAHGVPADVLRQAQNSLALAGISPPSTSPPPGSSSSVSPLADAAANLLVDLRAWRRHEPVEVLRRGVPLEFPASLEQEAQALLAHPPPDTCASVCIDLTHLPCVTIDDAGTKEVDDGLSVEYLDEDEGGTAGLQGKGDDWRGVRVWVHVADPTRWLTPGSALLEGARDRARTIYFPWGSVRMFPAALSEGVFSLRLDQECDALSVGIDIGPDGSLRNAQVAATRVRVSTAMTYTDADALLVAEAPDAGRDSQGEPAGIAAMLRVLRAVADARRSRREQDGSIEIPLPECKVLVDPSQLDSGRPAVRLERLSQWESPSRGLVAEMMIAAGDAIGQLGAAHGLTLPYRCQAQPSLPPADELAGVLEGVCRGYALRRCMTRSLVSAAPARHASLGLGAYVQVTSPIRRWADIVAHFNLKAWLVGLPPPYGASDVEAINAAATSDRLRAVAGAERAEEAYWVAEYFRQRQASKVQQAWPATVLGWHRQDLQLAAVLLDELGYEVVVKVDVEVRPGDFLQLALLEARPVAGVLRFYVAEYLPGPGWSEVLPTALSVDEVFAQLEADASAQRQEERMPVDADDAQAAAAGENTGRKFEFQP